MNFTAVLASALYDTRRTAHLQNVIPCSDKPDHLLRTKPQLRADRFVARWNDLGSLSQRQYVSGHMTEYHSTRSAMGDMAKSLERDPQLESILASRKQQLGIMFETGRSLGAELAFSHGIDLGRGRGLGL